MVTPRFLLLSWTVVVPLLAIVALAPTWGRDLGVVLVVAVAVIPAGAVLAAVHHAEVVAHRVGEPFGSAGPGGRGHGDRGRIDRHRHGLWRPGNCLTGAGHGVRRSDDHDQRYRRYLVAAGCAALRGDVVQRRGSGAALATVATLATLSLVLPTFTTSQPGPEFSPAQLTFAALAALALYGMFVLTQTVRHRDFFLAVTRDGVAVEGAFGSAMASIGLTIPVIALASVWLEGPLLLGLGSTQMVLLALTVVVSVLTVVPGRATRLQGGVHLVLLAAFLFLAINP